MDAEQLDLVTTEDLVGALRRRSSGSVIALLADVSDGAESRVVWWSGPFLGIGLCEWAKAKILREMSDPQRPNKQQNDDTLRGSSMKIIHGRDLEAAMDDVFHDTLDRAAQACYRLTAQWIGTDAWRALQGAAEEIEHLGGTCPYCKMLGMSRKDRISGDDVTVVNPP